MCTCLIFCAFTYLCRQIHIDMFYRSNVLQKTSCINILKWGVGIHCSLYCMLFTSKYYISLTDLLSLYYLEFCTFTIYFHSNMVFPIKKNSPAPADHVWNCIWMLIIFELYLNVYFSHRCQLITLRLIAFLVFAFVFVFTVHVCICAHVCICTSLFWNCICIWMCISPPVSVNHT